MVSVREDQPPLPNPTPAIAGTPIDGSRVDAEVSAQEAEAKWRV